MMTSLIVPRDQDVIQGVLRVYADWKQTSQCIVYPQATLSLAVELKTIYDYIQAEYTEQSGQTNSQAAEDIGHLVAHFKQHPPKKEIHVIALRALEKWAGIKNIKKVTALLAAMNIQLSGAGSVVQPQIVFVQSVQGLGALPCALADQCGVRVLALQEHLDQFESDLPESLEIIY